MGKLFEKLDIRVFTHLGCFGERLSGRVFGHSESNVPEMTRLVYISRWLRPREIFYSLYLKENVILLHVIAHVFCQVINFGSTEVPNQ